VSEALAAAEDQLLTTLAGAARGPRRSGTYALWLFLRACGAQLPPDRVSERSRRRQLQGLEKRLSTLTLPSPLRRALAGGMRALSHEGSQATAVALQQLAAPAGETIGQETSQALVLAARAAREALREMKEP